MKINEAAQQLQTSAWTLRYYEQIGVVAPVSRVNGIRDYTNDDLDQFREVLELRDCGVTLAEIRELLTLEATTDTADVRQQLLQNRAVALRHEISRLQAALDHLDAKITTITAQPERKLVSNGTN
ncbi:MULTISPECIES: MerR family transcriptional regulator [unclassified Levilactobacillus]|uniref:MerR family transcriptional regulator n=1 Tax=Lactobacillaceae TaxID=33958 RepID=UPI001456978D|nr:MerR family transcriptional regulator [Lactobacillus sp. HBUAS51381]